MKIRYSKKRLRTNLILGCAWTILSIAKLLFNEELKWPDYALFVLGLLYFALYLYEINYQYITIENGFIYKNWPFSKKLELAKVTQIKKFAGDVTLISEDKKLKIDTLILSAESKRILDEQLNIIPAV